ncbi:MAG: pyridoxamine 5'-phosphate oxidase family protein [Thermodesulfobacteriota bacterium]
MAEMTNRMKELFQNVPTAVLATATSDGAPNAVPVGAKKIIDDETVLISDQFFNKTLANMKSNPKVAVSFWEGHEGYQFKGTATIETSGQRYEETAKWIEELGNKAGHPLKSKGAVIIRIDEIYALAPGPGAGKKLAG